MEEDAENADLNENLLESFENDEQSVQQRPNKQIAKRVENTVADDPSWLDEREREHAEREKRRQKESQNREHEYQSRKNQRENESSWAADLFSQGPSTSNYRSSGSRSTRDDVRSPEKKKSKNYLYNYDYE